VLVKEDGDAGDRWPGCRGWDTHKDVHVGVVLDRLGRLAVREFPATDAGMAGWLAGLGQVIDAGVEGTGSYGYRLARLLADRGMQVWEVNCPDRSRRRRKGKSDPVDAENAARAVLSGEATAVPKDRRGFVGDLRLLVLTRRSAVKARTQASNQIKAFLAEADDELRASCTACARHRSGGPAPPWNLRRALAALGRRWLALDAEARELEAQITALIGAHAPVLLARHGVGAVTAAQLLVTAGANADRLRGTRPWPPCAAPARWRPPRARPAGTGSTAAATARPTTRCGSSPTSAPSPTRELAPSSPSAPRPATAAEK
jgi:transposase